MKLYEWQRTQLLKVSDSQDDVVYTDVGGCVRLLARAVVRLADDSDRPLESLNPSTWGPSTERGAVMEQKRLNYQYEVIDFRRMLQLWAGAEPHTTGEDMAEAVKRTVLVFLRELYQADARQQPRDRPAELLLRLIVRGA